MMERTKIARNAPVDRDVLDVPAPAPEEPWVFGTERRDAEHRGRQDRHGAHARTRAPAQRGERPDEAHPRRDGGARGGSRRGGARRRDRDRRRGRAGSRGARRGARRPGRVHVHAERPGRVRGAGHGRGPVPEPPDRRRPPVLPDRRGGQRGRAWRPGGGAPSRVAPPALRVRLRHPRVRRSASPEPARADPRRGRARRWDAGPAALTDRVTNESQRRSDPVRPRRQALRRDRRRRRGSRHGTGSLSLRAPREGPTAQPERHRARHEPDRGQRALVIRTPQLDRDGLRPRNRLVVGDARTGPTATTR